MGYTVEQDCPQCGAPIELDETDRLIQCPYCSVESYIHAPQYLRFILPHKAKHQDLIYAPYLRFKGNVYYIMGNTIGHRVVDITHVGVPVKGFPPSLGLRPQAMKMKFVTPDTTGTFLKFMLKAGDIVKRAAKLSTPQSKNRLYHRAYIGETLSLIYFPTYVFQDKLFDGVLNRPVAQLESAGDTLDRATNPNPDWQLTFTPTICPNCGWNMTGERDSVVLSCRNCDSAWEASGGRFYRIHSSVAGRENGTEMYLPFWKMAVSVRGLELNSFADFLRLTNQPRVVKDRFKESSLYFWSPAFKIRPKTFARLARQLTVCQKDFPKEGTVPRGKQHPVTLPRSEARQTMKLTLAGAANTKKDLLPRLPGVRIEAVDTELVWLPFKQTVHDWVQPESGVSVNASALAFGRKM